MTSIKCFVACITRLTKLFSRVKLTLQQCWHLIVHLKNVNHYKSTGNFATLLKYALTTVTQINWELL